MLSMLQYIYLVLTTHSSLYFVMADIHTTENRGKATAAYRCVGK